MDMPPILGTPAISDGFRERFLKLTRSAADNLGTEIVVGVRIVHRRGVALLVERPRGLEQWSAITAARSTKNQETEQSGTGEHGKSFR